jgi:hypothetical protein
MKSAPGLNNQPPSSPCIAWPAKRYMSAIRTNHAVKRYAGRPDPKMARNGQFRAIVPTRKRNTQNSFDFMLVSDCKRWGL